MLVDVILVYRRETSKPPFLLALTEGIATIPGCTADE